jgi:hypothetical protein
VDDDSEWYLIDDVECPGLNLVKLNPEPHTADSRNKGSSADVNAFESYQRAGRQHPNTAA